MKVDFGHIFASNGSEDLTCIKCGRLYHEMVEFQVPGKLLGEFQSLMCKAWDKNLKVFKFK